MSHTPGPWIVYVGEDDFDILPAGRPGEIAAAITNSANASLIAAAPDLLEAMKAIDAHWSAGNFSRMPGLWEQMRAAIAKAEAS